MRGRDGLEAKLGRNSLLEFFRSAVMNSTAKIFATKKAQEDVKGREEGGDFATRSTNDTKGEKNKCFARLFLSFCVFCAFCGENAFRLRSSFCVVSRLTLFYFELEAK